MLLEESEFNNKNNDLVHSLNFMNIAFTAFNYITTSATYMNKKLTKFLQDYSVPNEWFILDFPSINVIREIYNSNFGKNKPVYKPSAYIDLDVINKKNKESNLLICFATFGIVCDFGNYDSHHDLKRRDVMNNENNKETMICLQRIINTDEQGNPQDIVKTNYKCIDNDLNKWYIKQNNDDEKIYSIISLYDNKCLNYSGDILYVEKCKENNIYEKFTIKDNIICSQFDTTKCFNNFDIYPTSIKPKSYENLTCSTNFARLGIKCCSNSNAQVKYVDEVGNWGVENGELCGIGYERCSWSILGYPCCSSLNPTVIYTDENGSWGCEDGQWCGIGEITHDSKVRIKNKMTQNVL